MSTQTPPPESPESNERELIEELAGAYRPRDHRQLRFHPAFHDLGEEGRVQAHELALANRRLEAALDPDGLSSTARAVLERLGFA